MKKLALLFCISITALFSHAQVTPYTGGIGSGHAALASAATTCSFYYGGIADGAATNNTPPTICPLYFGGEGDGYSANNANCSSALPLTLITFYGEKEPQRNILHWKLSAGYDVKYFDIEKSVDGISYTTAGTVTGSTNSVHSYLFIDNNPFRDINFYRLRITGHANNITYSRVLVMKNFSSSLIRIYPNPASSTATLYYEASRSAGKQLIIYRYDGRVAFISHLQLTKGANYINIDLQHLADGLYFIGVGESADRIKLVVLKK